MQRLEQHVHSAAQNKLLDDWDFLELHPLLAKHIFHLKAHLVIQLVEKDNVQRSDAITFVVGKRRALPIQSFHGLSIAGVARGSKWLPHAHRSILSHCCLLITYELLDSRWFLLLTQGFPFEDLCLSTASIVLSLLRSEVLHSDPVLWQRALKGGPHCDEWSCDERKPNVSKRSSIGSSTRSYLHLFSQ